MKQVSNVFPGSHPVAGAQRLATNYRRVEQGLRPLARAHQPFNRRRPTFGHRQIDEIVTAGAEEGLSRGQQYELRRVLVDMQRKESEEQKEDFMLYFNAAYDAAREMIYAAAAQKDAKGRPLLRGPRTAIELYTTICNTCARRSVESALSRRELARRCRLSEREVSRHTAALERLDLLRTDPDGRGVRYIVLPVREHGLPLHHGDRISRADAGAKGLERLERERQAELALPS